MKKLFLFALISLLGLSSHAQNITGQWHGILKIQGIQLRVVFNIDEDGNGLHATMDSPDQGAKGIPVTTVIFDSSKLTLTVSNLRIEYEGVLKGSNVEGNFTQAGQSFPMNLTKEAIEKEEHNRPQEPMQPYPYYSEDITFENKSAAITLAGTLTLPKKEGVFPTVILISGSGPQNRDEELLGHKPFLVLSDYLTRNGIGVLRFDDRGTAMSKGDFKTATSLDFSGDVQAAVDYLKTRKEINKNKIGLVGHSEGGLIAPMVARTSNDIAFIVLMAGPGIPGDQILLLQQNLIGKASGTSDEILARSASINKNIFTIVKTSTNSEQLKTDLTNYLKQALADTPVELKPSGMSEEEYINLTVNQFLSPWMQYFIKYNPAPTLENVKCPVLAINGEKDLQVPPAENLSAIKKALVKGGNNKVITKVIPNLNHLFQECSTGAPSEYAVIEQTFSPVALLEILNWIKKQAQ